MDVSPFNNDMGAIFGVVNKEGQHSPWPSFADVLAGGRVVSREPIRAACLDYIERNCPDVRPTALRARLTPGSQA